MHRHRRPQSSITLSGHSTTIAVQTFGVSVGSLPITLILSWRGRRMSNRSSIPEEKRSVEENIENHMSNARKRQNLWCNEGNVENDWPNGDNFETLWPNRGNVENLWSNDKNMESIWHNEDNVKASDLTRRNVGNRWRIEENLENPWPNADALKASDLTRQKVENLRCNEENTENLWSSGENVGSVWPNRGKRRKPLTCGEDPCALHFVNLVNNSPYKVCFEPGSQRQRESYPLTPYQKKCYVVQSYLLATERYRHLKHTNIANVVQSL